jgi:uncharacterized OB-fold protein
MMLPEFAGFFENAAQQRLAFPYCRRCANFHWYPMPRCPHCRSRDIIWRSIEGRGELVSFSHVMHAFDKSRSDALPYVVALVKFADAPGVSLITNIDAPAMDTLQVGDSVVPVFRTDDGGQPMVEFRLA